MPADRVRYLSEITETVRGYHARTTELAEAARNLQRVQYVADALGDGDPGGVAALLDEARKAVPHEVADQIERWPAVVESYSGDEQVVKVRDREIHTKLTRESLSGNKIPRVALPRFTDHGELVRFWRRENLPGYFPFTAGVFPFKRENEDPTRMFAGEGDPFRTNKRFHLLSCDMPAKRLSTAFDSVTLYGFDPDERPDIYGKVGNSGVSIATLDDMKVLYSGFDLCDPTTSVSMTINGPAPTILAYFLNTVIDQQADKFRAEHDREPDASEYEQLRRFALSNVRGTVQADILKEDQGQNTCIFSTEFSLRMMADIQEWFIQQQVRNFYSVSISGYHIAEAGANPISQLAFTLANGFTYVEAYLARGMDIDDFAPNLSFFFSNGMDPEYSVLGRVARRIWAITMKEKYGANERSQKLKYHVQTSGRSLHAQEMDFNDIRTTLQALIAIYDNANSLHTNAYDEAITTPTEESVRRAMAIQLIINREWGLAKNENPNQGSFIIEELTDLVEAAVLAELDRLADRGGVLGAMETGYQRGRIQDESMRYEQRKHDGSLPIIGVNTFLDPAGRAEAPTSIERQTMRLHAANVCVKMGKPDHARALIDTVLPVEALPHQDVAQNAIQHARPEDVLLEDMPIIPMWSGGTAIAASDEVGDVQNLSMWLDVNGERKQTGTTATMIFDVATLVSYISEFMTLMPGDVITTGTPPGVGMGMKPEPQYLKAGDVVTLGIEGLGTSTQRVVGPVLREPQPRPGSWSSGRTRHCSMPRYRR